MPDATEIWFRVEKDSSGYPQSGEWEQLYAWPVDGGFKIDNIPFFVKGIAVGDVVSAVASKEGWLQFEHIKSASGHSTFRVWMSASSALEPKKVMEEIRLRGGQAELTLERLVAIDVGPEREAEVWDYLDAGRQRGDWDLQVGMSPE